MKWKSLGIVYALQAVEEFSAHTQVPTPVILGDVVRVYYACRMHGMSYPAYFDLDKNDMKTVVEEDALPIMKLGEPGMFDSDGIMPGAVIPDGDELWMYYTGWNEKTKTARYHNAIGLAVSKDGGRSFKQKFDGPIIDRTKDWSGLAVTPFVMRDEDYWKMWYISGVSWTQVDGKYEPQYVIKYADSINGINWNRYKDECVLPEHPLQAFSNPCVVKRGGKYHMYYCYRDSNDYRGGEGSYRIGHAISEYGITFQRQPDPEGLEGEWASSMLCYPYVIEIDGDLYMFYNGNDFGQTGIGLAVLEEI